MWYKIRNVFPGSSVVEQAAVNRSVAGSSPARGAKALHSYTRSLSMREVLSHIMRTLGPRGLIAGFELKAYQIASDYMFNYTLLSPYFSTKA